MKKYTDLIEKIVKWLQHYLALTGAKGFVIGISGGKDSTVTAALLCKAVGHEKIKALLMPNGEQADIEDSIKVCNHLNLKYEIVNIHNAYLALLNETTPFSPHTITNIPPRLRMTVMYAYAQELNYLVCGTGNASERYIGYCTKWGDTANDLNPLGELLSKDVVAIGEALGLPYELVHKTPSDGLTGKSDEENIGFTYQALNNYIETGEAGDPAAEEKIKKMHNSSRHKFNPIPIFKP